MYDDFIHLWAFARLPYFGECSEGRVERRARVLYLHVVESYTAERGDLSFGEELCEPLSLSRTDGPHWYSVITGNPYKDWISPLNRLGPRLREFALRPVIPHAFFFLLH